MDFSQFSGFIVFLVIFTTGFWLMIFLLMFAIPYWLLGNILEAIKYKKISKKKNS